MNVFISHNTEEAPLALFLKRFIKKAFLGKIDVFVSSDVQDLGPGDRFVKRIVTALEQSKVLIIICSPSSIARPWINFEAGYGWAKQMRIIPVCHSGQHVDQLPFPHNNYQALQLEDEAFFNRLVTALCTTFKFDAPPLALATLRKELNKVKDTLRGAEAPLLIIHSRGERTRLINKDLRTLLNRIDPSKETVWTSAFLSTFAISPDDPYPDDQQEYLGLLLKERDLLLELARRGCTIKCIVSPANSNHIRHAGIEYASKRTERLLDFVSGKDKALNFIDWAVSELGMKNLYIIGRLSCFEGFKKGIQQGYDFTLRQTSADLVSANIDVYSRFFNDLAARSLAKWANKDDGENTQRELLRIAVRRCLEESIGFLSNISAEMR